MAIYSVNGSNTKSGIEKLLPVCEVEILRILWSNGPQQINALHDIIRAQRDIAYTTTMSTCVRMVSKGLLRRQKGRKGVPFIYEAVFTEREIIAAAMADFLDSIIREYPSALTHYLDARRDHAAM